MELVVRLYFMRHLFSMRTTCLSVTVLGQFLGRWVYFRDLLNCIDVLLVVLPMLDLYLLTPLAGHSHNINMLRALRLAKMARLLDAFGLCLHESPWKQSSQGSCHTNHADITSFSRHAQT